MKKLTREEFIGKAIAVHSFKYDYSKVVYKNCYTGIDIICPEHGCFRQRPYTHIAGGGCPNCYGNKKHTTATFIKKATEVHGNKYDYSKVNYVNGSVKVCIICQKHGKFWQRPRNHINAKQKCPKCSAIVVKEKHRSTTEKFIKNAKKIHNNKYDYSKVNYKSAMEKVIIVCPEHGEFLQEPNSHINHKTGCPYCGRTKKKTIEEFISIAKKIHGNRYNYDKVNYINGNSKVIIICPIHGKFLQSPDDHINQKSGCSSCSGVKKLTTKEFITKAKKIHGNYYDYSKVNYINSQKNITIICPIHGDFSQRPNSHTSYQMQGCPKCQSSKNEMVIGKMLYNNDIKYEEQKTFKNCVNPKTNRRLKYDFYLPEQNILIEYNGKQHYQYIKRWHQNEQSLASQQFRDSIKKQYALSHGYKFLVIKYNENVKEMLKKHLSI